MDYISKCYSCKETKALTKYQKIKVNNRRRSVWLCGDCDFVKEEIKDLSATLLKKEKETKYNSAVTIVKKLKESGYESYFVGGWVRDKLLKEIKHDTPDGLPKDIKDWKAIDFTNIPSETKDKAWTEHIKKENEIEIDIATSCPIEKIPKLFKHCDLVGMAFGIAIVRIGDKHKFDVATFRLEINYKDGRHPETIIQPTTAEKDAQRRDFTINALFYDPLEDKVIDYVDGQEDLKNKIIRAVGNPYERFEEDKLRMLRAVRFATKLNFTIEEKTKQAIIKLASTLSKIAVERIWIELEKTDKDGNLGKALLLLYELELLKEIFPKMKETHKFSSWKMTFTDLKGEFKLKRFVKKFDELPFEMSTIAKIWTLFSRLDLKECKELCDYYKIPNRDREIPYLLTNHRTYLFNTFSLVHPKTFPLEKTMACAFALNAKLDIRKMEVINWVKFYANPNSQIVLEIVFKNIGEKAKKSKGNKYLDFHQKQRKKYAKQIKRIKNNNPVLKAEHLETEGIKPSEKLGLLLKEGEKIAINQQLEDPKKIISELKKTTLWTK